MAETLTDYEQKLVEKFKDLTIKKKEAEAVAEAAGKEYYECEREILKFLEDDGNRKRTGEYRGLGWITVVDKALSASIEEGRSVEVLEYVKNMGREDMIKTSIHSKTLSSFVEQCLQQNLPLPPGVTFYRPRQARFYADKK